MLTVVLTASLLSFGIQSAAALPATLNVCASRLDTMIQFPVNAAKDGNTAQVDHGTYKENITIPGKYIRLSGNIAGGVNL
ncbi:MAG: hypothetical protein H7288_20625 [Kineosporiaceae bacterium]|nr:hypothetical protein [Aeromicrobium sp.]